MKNRIITIFVSVIVFTAVATIGSNKLEATLCGEEVYQDTINKMDNYAVIPTGSSNLALSFEEDSTSILSCSAEQILQLAVE